MFKTRLEGKTKEVDHDNNWTAMRQVKQFLAILVILALLLIIYELLLTPNVPTIAAQQGRSLYQHMGSYRKTDTSYQHAVALEVTDSPNQNVASLERTKPPRGPMGHDPGKHTLRQLLQDEEITSLPVKIFTDCPNAPEHSIYTNLKNQNSDLQNEQSLLSQNPNVVCLNESKLYKDSYSHYGVAFDRLSLLQQKASIVRAVLFDLEQRQQQPGVRVKKKLIVGEVPNVDTQDPKKLKRDIRLSEQVLRPEGPDLDPDDEGYDYDDQNPESKELKEEIKELKNLVTQRANQIEEAHPTPRILYFPRAHPPPHPQVHNSQPKPPPKQQKKKDKMSPKMNPDLIKFKGTKVEQSSDLSKRGFPVEWRVDSSIVHDRLKFISMAINGTDPSERSVTGSSLNPDLLQRAKFQRDQVSQFCRQHTHPPSTLPLENMELDTLFQHLLYDDTHKIVFCYVPKNGCSNVKRLMLVLNGILPPDASHKRRPEEVVLKQVHSFRNLTYEEAMYKLQHYFKFAIVRNPLERLLSAYKNKLERPFNIELRKFFPERLKAFILKLYRREEFEKWIARNNSLEDIHPSFDEFVQFMNSYPLTAYNEHFKPFLELCNPCAVNFDLFLSFKTLEYDVYALLDYLNIPLSLYPESIAHHSKPISEYMGEYYSAVSPSSKSTLFRRFSREFDFFFSLHPEEWGMNTHL